MALVLKIQECINGRIGEHYHVTAVTPVSAVRLPMLYACIAEIAIAAISSAAGLNMDLGAINKHRAP